MTEANPVVVVTQACGIQIDEPPPRKPALRPGQERYQVNNFLPIETIRHRLGTDKTFFFYFLYI